MTIELTLAADPEFVLVRLREDWHLVNNDECNCTARSFGNVCSHLKLLHGLGGFEVVRKALERDERRKVKAQKAARPGSSISCTTALRG
jgi:hypothetical protein